MSDHHGTWHGYNLGCRQECCREAARLYQKRRMLDAQRGISRKVDSTGLIRRVQALNSLGWSNYSIATRAGVQREQIRQWCQRKSVYRASHDTVARIYDELSMTLPPQRTRYERMDVTRTRNRARRLGFLPPLAWDDIDRDEAPRGGRYQRSRSADEVDEAAVLRVLGGERVRTTRAEKEEIVRRWRALGRPLNALEELLGVKPERYYRREEGAA